MKRKLINSIFFFLLIVFPRNSSAQWDYGLGIGAQSLPMGGSAFFQGGYGQLLWDKTSVNPIYYSYLRPSFQFSTSGIINRGELALNYYPISFFGISLGHSKSLRLSNSKVFNCDIINCLGILHSNFFKTEILLGYDHYFVIGKFRYNFLSPSSTGRPFGDENSYLIGNATGDQLLAQDLIFGAKLGSHYKAGISLSSKKMIHHGSLQQFKTGFFQMVRGKWVYILGAGIYESNVQKPGFTSYLLIQWVGISSIGL